MGILEVGQIRNKLREEYSGLINMEDINAGDANEIEKNFLSRALAAYSISILYPTAEKEIVSKYIVDGSEDNGIDLIYYNKDTNELCLVQSKFNQKGDTEPDLGEIQRFTTGVKDLINTKFDKFNAKVNSLKSEIIETLQRSRLKIKIILIYTAINLSTHAKREFADLLETLNDFRDVAELEVINQKRVHASLHTLGSSRNIEVVIQLKQWGRYDGEMESFYGQISADQVADWWESYGNSLYDYNLRKLLGTTDINNEIRETLETEPELFWYFNNGVTLVCEEVDKKRIYGNTRDIGIFECKGVSIVNGAQTVGVIGKYGQSSAENRESLGQVFLPFRIISIKRSDEDGADFLDETFASDVTTTNNRQNKVENRDFVVLDPLQKKIEHDLAIIGITYHLMRSEDEEKVNENSFNLRDATRALSFASDIDATILVSREIGSIYSDLNSPRYKKLYNPSTTSYYVWNCVRIQRVIETIFNDFGTDLSDTKVAVLVHGKELMSKLVFDQFGTERIARQSTEIDSILEAFEFRSKLDQILNILEDKVSRIDKSIINIFKSPGDMKLLYNDVTSALGGNSGVATTPGVFDVNQVEGLSRLEKLQLTKFHNKIQDDVLAISFFEKWLTQIYDSERHFIGYRSNVHFYLDNEEVQATEKFLFRIAYYTKLIVSFEFSAFGSLYKSMLYTNQGFAEWAEQNTDSKNRVVINSEADIEKLLRVIEFIKAAE
jgi:hypothetical protein